MRSSAPSERGLSAVKRLLFAILLPLALTSCGPERDFSGVWRQTFCDDDLARPDCNGFVYELHIGRYGDRLSGVVVRYVYDRGGFDSFQRPKECGCFLIEGGIADEEGMQLSLFDPTTPRYPQPDTRDADLGCQTRALLTDCPERRFALTGDDELMEGETDCGNGSPLPIAFERVVGTPRSECYEHLGSTP